MVFSGKTRLSPTSARRSNSLCVLAFGAACFLQAAFFATFRSGSSAFGGPANNLRPIFSSASPPLAAEESNAERCIIAPPVILTFWPKNLISGRSLRTGRTMCGPPRREAAARSGSAGNTQKNVLLSGAARRSQHEQRPLADYVLQGGGGQAAAQSRIFSPRGRPSRSPARWLFRNAFGALSLRRLHAFGVPPPAAEEKIFTGCGSL